MPRKAKDGKEKSAQELEKVYIEKIEHSMERVAMWSGKLVKLVKSKKGYLTDGDKTKLKNDYAELAEGILETMTAKGDQSPSGYRLR